MVTTIRLLGEPAIFDGEGRIQPVRGHQPWALLARLVLSRAPLDRRALADELFQETADPLGALRWGLAALRKALDCAECLRGDPIETDFPQTVEIDVLRLERGDLDIEDAGPLLGTLEPRCGAEFSTWLLAERERIAGIVDGRIRRETLAAIAVGDHVRAIRLAELAARRDPFNESAQILFAKSLAAAGRFDAALRHVEVMEALYLAELGEKPSPALRSAARRTVSAAPAGISQAAFVSSLLQSGLAALAAGATDAGIDCLRRAAGDAERAGDDHLLARTTFELGTALVHSVRGFDDEGSVLLRQSTELSRQHGYDDLAVSGLRELGYVEALAGRRPASAEYLAAAGDFAMDDDGRAGIHAVTGFNLADWGKAEAAFENYEISLDCARTAGNRRREIWSLGLGAWGLVGDGRFEDAREWVDDCLRLVETQNWLAFRPFPVAILAEVELELGAEPASLRPALEEAFALSCQLQDPCWEAAIARVLALTHLAGRDYPSAEKWLGEAARRCARDIDAYAALQVEIAASRVRLAEAMDDAAMAGAAAREWIALAARTHMDRHVARAAAFIAGG